MLLSIRAVSVSNNQMFNFSNYTTVQMSARERLCLCVWDWIKPTYVFNMVLFFLLVSKFFMSVMRRSEVLGRVSHNTAICGSQIICRQDGIFVWLSFTEEMHEFGLLWTNTVIPIHRRNPHLFFSARTQVNMETATTEKLWHDVDVAPQNIFGSCFFAWRCWRVCWESPSPAGWGATGPARGTHVL